MGVATQSVLGMDRFMMKETPGVQINVPSVYVRYVEIQLLTLSHIQTLSETFAADF